MLKCKTIPKLYHKFESRLIKFKCNWRLHVYKLVFTARIFLWQRFILFINRIKKTKNTEFNFNLDLYVKK